MIIEKFWRLHTAFAKLKVVMHSLVDPMCDVPTLKKKKKKKVGIYKFKKYGFAKVPTLIFVLEKKKKKLRKINLSKLQQTTQTIQNYNIHHT